MPNNCFYYPTSLEEGAKINAVIAASDILFLVYNNFRSSSNFSTKAALFKKPVLASGRFWIGAATNTYSMGETVIEETEEKMLMALKELKNQLKHNNFNYSGFENYLKIHQEDRLLQALHSALELSDRKT